MPFSNVLSVVALCLIFIFLVTSADSATYIVSQMTDKRLAQSAAAQARDLGRADRCDLPDPALGRRREWPQGVAVGGGAVALPFTFILYGMISVMIKELRADRKAMLTALYRRHSETPVGADAFEAEELVDEDRYRRAPDVKNRRINPR